MTSSNLLSIVTFIYGLSAAFYVAAAVFKKQGSAKIASWIAIVGLLGNTTGIAMRWAESYKMGIGHAPLSNMYESLVFFAWTIMLIYLIIERRYYFYLIGAFSTPTAFLVMAYASLSGNISDRIQPLVPALKSNWLIVHVITCFIGYAAFAIALGTSVMYLIRKGARDNAKGWVSWFPEPSILDELTYQMVIFGFLFLSVGIITGSVWANSAWGSYWSWDPKETWSLITWFVYATLIHARLMRGWRGKRLAFISIVGFCAVLFTYFGVNYLPGLHSYAK